MMHNKEKVANRGAAIERGETFISRDNLAILVAVFKFN